MLFVIHVIYILCQVLEDENHHEIMQFGLLAVPAGPVVHHDNDDSQYNLIPRVAIFCILHKTSMQNGCKDIFANRTLKSIKRIWHANVL